MIRILSDDALHFAISKVEKDILKHAQEYVNNIQEAKGVEIDCLEVKRFWLTDSVNLKLRLFKRNTHE